MLAWEYSHTSMKPSRQYVILCFLTATGLMIKTSLAAVLCKLELRSYGNEAAGGERYSHIRINGVNQMNQFSRGFCLGTLEIKKDTCHMEGTSCFDTYGSTNASENMTEFIRSKPLGSVILAVTSDSAEASLSPALPALQQLGVDASNLTLRESLAFVAIKVGNYTSTRSVSQKATRAEGFVEMTVNIKMCQFITVKKDQKPVTTPSKSLIVHSMTSCAFLCYIDTTCHAFVVKKVEINMECGFYSVIEDAFAEDPDSIYGQLFFRIITQ